MSDASTYGMAAADGGAYLGSASWLLLIVFVVLLPVIAVLVLIGLIYELVIRVDGHRLNRVIEWAISTVAALALLAGLFVVIVRP